MLRFRRWSCALAAGLLVCGPTVLAFFDGGVFDKPRLVAAIVAWLLVGVTALAADRPLARHWPGRLAIAGLLLLSAWAALSLAWAPLGTPALADVQRLALYCAVLIASAAWFGRSLAANPLEPGLLLGTVVVIGCGMSERFLPGLIGLQPSSLAFGRLEQPVGYWNGIGLLAALGLVLSARVGAGTARPVAVRAAGAAAAPLLGASLLLTLSRGSFIALAAGLLVLLLLAPERAQPRSLALVVGAAGLAAVLAALLPGLDVAGGRASRSSGALLLAATAVLSAAGALVQRRLARGSADGAMRAHASARGWRLAAAVAAAAALAAAAGAIDPSESLEEGTGTRDTERLATLESERYRYWDVALQTFAQHPVAGVGTAGFRVEWARDRGERGPAQDAHSLYLETLAELGLVGLACLVAFLAGLVWSGRRALLRHRRASVGPAAVVSTWAFHAGIDWTWEVPAVTLPALLAAGMLVAMGDRDEADVPSGEREPAVAAP